VPAGDSARASVQAAPATQGGDCPSLCSLASVRYEAAPGLLLAGEAITVSIAPRFVCRGIDERMNIVLAASQSVDLDRHEMRKITDAMDRLLDRLDLPNNPNTRIAVVDAPVEARTLVTLSNDENLVRRGIHRVEMEGESNLAGLLEEAERSLRQGQVSNCFEQSMEILVLFASDQDRRNCSQAQRAKYQLRKLGALVVVVFADSRFISGCVRGIASSARYFYLLENNLVRLEQVFDRLRGDLYNITVRQLEVVALLSDGAGFEPGSSVPAADWDVDAGSLNWALSFVPREGITVSYRTRPTGVGLIPVGRGVELHWRDNQNRASWARLDPPFVQAFGAPQREP
jgi:hypothetical protein